MLRNRWRRSKYDSTLLYGKTFRTPFERGRRDVAAKRALFFDGRRQWKDAKSWQHRALKTSNKRQAFTEQKEENKHNTNSRKKKKQTTTQCLAYHWLSTKRQTSTIDVVKQAVRDALKRGKILYNEGQFVQCKTMFLLSLSRAHSLECKNAKN